MKRSLFLLCVLVTFAVNAQAAVCTLDDLLLDPDSYYGGAGSGAGDWTNGDAYFVHYADDYSWSGFTYSNVNDTTTPGYLNQFAAITGTDVSGTGNYGVSYIPLDWMGGTYDPIPQFVALGAVTGEDYNTTISGLYITNTTYAYLSMLNGDSFAKKFGGESGDDPDYFKVIIKGVDEEAAYTGTVEFYLADFRFEDNNQDYIVDAWTWVDLTSLGNVVGLEFSIDSSDAGAYGINTPAYFAFDNINDITDPGGWGAASTVNADYRASSDAANYVFLMCIPFGAVLLLKGLRRRQ
jgi:hypothetical protein